MKRRILVLTAGLLAFLVVGSISARMAEDLVTYLPFTGNANDESGNGNDAVVVGATLTTDRFGYPNSAYWFGGMGSSRLELPTLRSYSPTFLTIHAWVKPATLGTRKMIVIKATGADTPGNLAFELWNDRIVMHLNKGSWYSSWGATPLSPGTWYHVAATYDGASMKVFLNGALDGELPYSGGIGVNDIPWMIGVHPCGEGVCEGFSFEGAIDDVRIYGRALSEAEIQGLYNGEVPPPPPGPCDQVKAELAAANEQILQLQSQLDSASQSISLLQASNTQLQSQLGAVDQQIQALSLMFARTFGNPMFTIPGTTADQKAQSLANAIGQLNHGQQQALYKNLGGKK